MPPPAIYILSILLPGLSVDNIFGAAIYFEIERKDQNEGLMWSDLFAEGGVKSMNNIQPGMFLLYQIGNLFLFIFLLMWAWPRKMNNDGRKLSLCYCLSPAYWRNEDKNVYPSKEEISNALLEEYEKLDYLKD